jgi:hypothetical protein
MAHIGIVLLVLAALIIAALTLIPSLRKTVVSSFKEGQKTGEDWSKNSAIGNIAHDLGKKVGEVQKNLKK